MMKPTLRHLKKEATSQALARAAFELARSRGMDGFIVDDIVQQAGVSRRTFANYFTCKEEAVAAGALEPSQSQVEEFVELVGTLEEDAPIVDILFELMKMQLTSRILMHMQELSRMAQDHATLHPYLLNAVQRIQREAEDTLLELSGGRYDDMYMKMLVGALYGAIVPFINGSLEIELVDDRGEIQHAEFDEYVQKVYHYLKNGFK